MKHAFSIAAALLALAGCASTPTSIVKGPTSVRPMIADAGLPSEGAIYNSSSFRPHLIYFLNQDTLEVS